MNRKPQDFSQHFKNYHFTQDSDEDDVCFPIHQANFKQISKLEKKNNINNHYLENNSTQNFGKKIYFNDFEKSTNEDNHNDESNEDNKRFSYCYLCSIKAHKHEKSEPVPMHKRRYLKPYLNPVQLIKKYEKNQYDLEIKTKYKFLIKTGTDINAGTNSNVWFKLYGIAGTWEQTELKIKNSNGMKFPPNSLVEIDLEGPIIGDLKKLKIWHDGQSIKDAWYLDFVEITCYRQMQTWRFVCDQWLSVHRSPNFSNSIVLTLNGNIFDNEKSRNSTEYFILIKTSSKPLIGHEINCQIQFSGNKYQSQVFNLLTPYVNLFEKNQLDCFLVMSSHDLGRPEKFKLAHNSLKLQHDWSIDFIKILYSREPDRFYVFKVDKWLNKNDKMNAIINLDTNILINNKENSNTGKMIYHITVLTGNSKNAGTDSKIYIELKGTKGVTKPHRLHNPKSNREFERNQMDHFHILDEDIGEIKMLRIYHDNSGNSPDWFLDTVLIRPISTIISGIESKHDSDLFNQLDKLKKKFIIKDMKLELNDTDRKKTKRSKSAELYKANKLAKNKLMLKKYPRSASVDLKNNFVNLDKSDEQINLKNVLKKNHVSKKSLPSSSILRKSDSPRTSKENSGKHVKFVSQINKENHNNKDNSEENTKTNQDLKNSKQKIEMSINWLMSIKYNDNASVTDIIDNIKTIENYDKTIKNIDIKLINLYDSKTKKFKSKKDSNLLNEEVKSFKTEKNNEHLMYVFECNKWLAKDKEDFKIERILKLSNILRLN